MNFSTHGNEPFVKHNPKHQKILSTLKDKTDKWASKLTIKIWSKVDPLKRITAKKNKIPFVEWFSLEEFDAWYDLQRSNKNLKVKHEIC